jgi:hypothetical protein
MDIHPWTKYEIARIRDEERLLRARAAMQSRELRKAQEIEAAGVMRSSFLDRLRRREPVAEQAPAGARPA